MSTATIDPAIIEQKAGMAFGYLTGAIVSGMIYLGEKMGLYRAMAGAGPLSSEELAAKTGLNERWLREWLRGQGAAGMLEIRAGERFELTPELALCLADENTPASVVGIFSELPGLMQLLPKLPRAFKSGMGFTYEDGGEAVAGGTERMLGPWNRSALITDAIPKLDGVLAKLEAGARVADIGCGAAVATTAMAKAFPKSEFHGYDNSATALAHAEANKAKLGVTNVHFHNPDNGDGLPAAPTYDFMTFLDVLHDMARPDLVLAAARKAMKADGQAFIVDVNCSESYEENLKNPLAPMLWGISVMLCMSSSSSTPDGMKLGTVGLPEPKMRELVLASGFSSLKPVPGLEHPFNAYYTALP